MTTATSISRQLQEKLDSELHVGETIEWMDQPITHIISLSCILVVGTALSSLIGLLLSSDRTFIAFLAIFAASVPFGLLLYLQHLFKLATVYAITNKRIIMISGLSSCTINSYEAFQLVNIYRTEHRDGLGDVIFAKEWYNNGDATHTKIDIGFFNIQNPKAVEDKIKKLSFSSMLPVVLANANEDPNDICVEEVLLKNVVYDCNSNHTFQCSNRSEV
jgi:hypothetical protein